MPFRRRGEPYPAWIEVAGFKSIHDAARVAVRPLTLLAGANSSGKSSMFQPLLLLKQTFESTFTAAPLKLDGPHVTFTAIEQFLSRGRRRDSRAGAMTISLGPPVGAGEQDDKSRALETRLRLSPAGKRFASLKAETQIRAAGTGRWVAVKPGNEAALAKLMGIDPAGYDIRIYGEGMGAAIRGIPKGLDPSRFPARRRLDIDHHHEWITGALHLPGHRGHRERRYAVTAFESSVRGRISVRGPAHPYTASILHAWKEAVATQDTPSRERDGAQARLDRVTDALQQLGLTWKVDARMANAAEMDLRVGRMPEAQQGGAHDVVDIADVGFGLSQVLPVVVALAAAEPGQLVLIEQPELHLHPRAQVAMAGVIVDAARRGVIVVAETHSQLVLRSVQTAVARGRLPAKDVGLHWFSRDPESGWTRVTRADLQDDGSFGEWPVDFPDVYATADSDYIDAVFAAHGRR